MKEIKAKDMQLCDVVAIKLKDGISAFGASIVINIDETQVRLWRPYGTTADFKYTGGVIPYVGIEDYKLPLTSDLTYFLLERRTTPLK